MKVPFRDLEGPEMSLDVGICSEAEIPKRIKRLLRKKKRDTSIITIKKDKNDSYYIDDHGIDLICKKYNCDIKNCYELVIENEDLESLEILVDNDVSMGNDMHGMTYLYRAASKGKIKIVETLLNLGVPMKADNFRDTPLNGAADKGHVDIVKLLLDNGASMDKNLFGDTPLHVASCRGHLEIVKILLLHGAPQIKNIKGFTPRSYAEARGHEEILALFK